MVVSVSLNRTTQQLDQLLATACQVLFFFVLVLLFVELPVPVTTVFAQACVAIAKDFVYFRDRRDGHSLLCILFNDISTFLGHYSVKYVLDDCTK